MTNGDSQVKEDKPDTNEGTNDRVEVKAQTNKVARVFLQFDLSSIPSTATIDTALVRTLIETPPNASETYEAQRAAAAWDELTITWNNQPGVSGTAVTTQTGTTGGVWNEWGVGADVQDFVDGTATNNGWRIKAQDEASNEKTKYHSKENIIDPSLSPQIRVFYATP